MIKKRRAEPAPEFTVRWNPDAPPHLIGYARVSTEEQNLNLQTDALEKAGVLDDDIHVEKVSGASSKRPMLDWAIKCLRPGDTFVVWKLDRVARSLVDLLRRMKQIEDAKAQFKSITESIDTASPQGKFLIGILGSVAQLERDLIVERTKAGVAAARARGQRVGQPEVLTVEQKAKAQKMRDRKISVRVIAKTFNVSHGTIYNHTVGLTRTRTKQK